MAPARCLLFWKKVLFFQIETNHLTGKLKVVRAALSSSSACITVWVLINQWHPAKWIACRTVGSVPPCRITEVTSPLWGNQGQKFSVSELARPCMAVNIASFLSQMRLVFKLYFIHTYLEGACICHFCSDRVTDSLPFHGRDPHRQQMNKYCSPQTWQKFCFG